MSQTKAQKWVYDQPTYSQVNNYDNLLDANDRITAHFKQTDNTDKNTFGTGKQDYYPHCKLAAQLNMSVVITNKQPLTSL